MADERTADGRIRHRDVAASAWRGCGREMGAAADTSASGLYQQGTLAVAATTRGSSVGTSGITFLTPRLQHKKDLSLVAPNFNLQT